MRRRATRAVPRPFLKWVGGKGQILDHLMRRVALAEPFRRYHEPFVGGGALFFELARQRRLGRSKACLSDSNRNLMDAYVGVRDDVEGVIALLEEHKRLHSKDYYYEVRAVVPGSLTERAARIIYLNKTCFNGLFRENSKGQFNVPMGRYENPPICDKENLRACAEVLKRARLETRHFETVLDRAKPGDFIYFDPPYVPLSKTASFTSYDKSGFGDDSQRLLARVFEALAARGVKVLLSNSMTDLVRELYDGDKYEVDQVPAKRVVNSRADRRGEVSDALVRSF